MLSALLLLLLSFDTDFMGKKHQGISEVAFAPPPISLILSYYDIQPL